MIASVVKWQHRVVVVPRHLSPDEKAARLDAAGSAGWELVSAVGHGDNVEYVFRGRVVDLQEGFQDRAPGGRRRV